MDKDRQTVNQRGNAMVMTRRVHTRSITAIDADIKAASARMDTLTSFAALIGATPDEIVEGDATMRTLQRLAREKLAALDPSFAAYVLPAPTDTRKEPIMATKTLDTRTTAPITANGN